MNRYYLPLVAFVLLSVALLGGLRLDPRHIPSPFIGKSAPHFQLPRLDAPDESLTTADFLEEVWVLNIWASWCAACLEEHPLLHQFLKDEVKLVGLNYKDETSAAQQWLKKWGDPYALSLYDETGLAGLDWGVYGVPETFVIDRRGVVQYKHIGPLRQQDITETLLPLIRTLRGVTQ